MINTYYQNKPRAGFKFVDLYYDPSTLQVMSRCDWIDYYQYSCRTGFLKDWYKQYSDRELKTIAAQSFEELKSIGELKFYGIEEVPELSGDEDYIENPFS